MDIMGSRAVFFDADGTICDIEKGIPDSTLQAIQALRRKGHRAFLCTGRSRAFVTEDLEQAGFEGIVAACGAYLEYEGKRLFSQEQTPEQSWRSIRILRQYGLVPVMEGPDHMYYDGEEYNEMVDWYAPLITRQLGSRLLPIRGHEKDLRANKISAKARPGSDPERACSLLADTYDTIRHQEGMAGGTIELIPKGFSKAVGIASLCRILKIDWKNTVIFGDSNNDLSMFQYAAVKVAMGNAPQKIRNLADYVTEDMFHGGIQKGLRALKLIE